MNEPLWTDVAQATVAIFGLMATIIGIYVLLRRDKDKEEQIKKLGNIAEQLNLMLEDSERRYRISKKPHIQILSEYLDEGCIGLIFVNSNTNTSIAYYDALDSETNEGVGFTHQSKDSNGKQKLPLNIPIENAPFAVKITMKYYTTEGFIYLQYMTVMLTEEYHVIVHPSPVSHEDEAF